MEGLKVETLAFTACLFWWLFVCSTQTFVLFFLNVLVCLPFLTEPWSSVSALLS